MAYHNQDNNSELSVVSRCLLISAVVMLVLAVIGLVVKEAFSTNVVVERYMPILLTILGLVILGVFVALYASQMKDDLAPESEKSASNSPDFPAQVFFDSTKAVPVTGLETGQPSKSRKTVIRFINQELGFSAKSNILKRSPTSDIIKSVKVPQKIAASSANAPKRLPIAAKTGNAKLPQKTAASLAGAPKRSLVAAKTGSVKGLGLQKKTAFSALKHLFTSDKAKSAKGLQKKASSSSLKLSSTTAKTKSIKGLQKTVASSALKNSSAAAKAKIVKGVQKRLSAKAKIQSAKKLQKKAASPHKLFKDSSAKKETHAAKSHSASTKKYAMLKKHP